MFTYEEANKKEKKNTIQQKGIPKDNVKINQRKKSEERKAQEKTAYSYPINSIRIQYAEKSPIPLKVLSYYERKELKKEERNIKSTFNNGQVIQRLEYDETNPHERGAVESPKVHHIIPHIVLYNKYNAVTSADSKTTVRKSFIPDIEKLTIRQLGLIFRTWKFTNGAEIYKYKKDQLVDSWAEDYLTEACAYGIDNSPFHSMAEFIELYHAYKEDDKTKHFSSEQLEALETLSNSYYTWSAGNLFYGVDHRAEPSGAKQDEFDTDAKYFKGVEYTDHLKMLYDNLNTAKNSEGITNALCAIGNFTKNAGIGPINDPSKWIEMKGEMKTLFKAFCQGGRKDYFDTHDGFVPIQFVKEEINKIMTDKTIRDLYLYIKELGDIPASLRPLLQIFQIVTVEKKGIAYTKISYGSEFLRIRRDCLNLFKLNEFRENIKGLIKSSIPIYT